MKYRFSIFVLMAAALLGLCAVARAEYDWHWRWPQLLQANFQSDDIVLTNNGARALAYGWDDDAQQVRGVVAFANLRAYALCIFDGEPQTLEQPNGNTNCDDKAAVAVSFGATSKQKHVLWPTPGGLVEYADTLLSTIVPNQNPWADLEEWDAAAEEIDDVAIAAHRRLGTDYVCVCYYDEPDEGSPGLYTRITANQGYTWGDPVLVLESGDVDNFSLAASESESKMYLALHEDVGGDDHVKVFKSTDNGASWAANPVLDLSNAVEPCIALDGSRIVLVCVGTNGENDLKIRCRTSGDGGSSWNDPGNPFNQDPSFEYAAPSVSIIEPPDEHKIVNITAELTSYDDWVSSTWGRVSGGTIVWTSWKEHWLSSRWPVGPTVDGDENPCIGTCIDLADSDPARALCVWADDGIYAGGTPYSDLYGNFATWKYRYPNNVAIPPIHADGPGRRIHVDLDGTPHYVARVGANIHCGQVRVNGFLEPTLLGSGTLSALAMDAGGGTWACFLSEDTVWCRTGNGRYKAVFAGSSSAVPGQPSIVCYPNQANGSYVANVVFCCYDTSGGSTLVLYARVDTGQVVLDTIESVANLRDSLPTINVFRTDSLITTWQHGDSVISSLLADYGPGTGSRPGAWSSPNLVTADGYHAMSAFDGSVLNCVWTGKNGDNYGIRRATNDLSGGMFPSWTAQSDPSGSATSEKGNSVYAGIGVTCWQEKVSGKWVIKGKVRGEETTFVASDTDAYHPHAVAESSAVSPSIDQLRVYLLYTAGVTFEVDSGVVDTGEARFFACSLDVSHAGSDATKTNNGSKFLRKASGDSLFCVYADLDGAVMYARSAAGDSWQRSVMLTGRAWPAIAEDSSGKRWVVVHKQSGTQSQEAYYRNGSSWTGPQTLYTSPQNGTLGPASLAGASYTSSGIAYAAFLATLGGTKSVILAKFNGSVLATYVVATGVNLSDPALAVEPYLQDSDRVHVTWKENGVIKYRMDTDGRSQSIASKWTSTVSLSNAQVTSMHPGIRADRNQVVAAWAQGDTTEIYCRKRSTDSAYNNWESAVNLSNTAGKFSDWPTIAMGDTVIVAWEERRTVTDYDILASINFGDTLSIADNSTKSGYPHVLFQNQTSGDTAIPYLHTVWSETPEANVYEVGYNKLNLKQSGEGPQSAGPAPLPRRPSLSACRPNPFRDRTQISYQLPSAGNVSLRVYDVTGRTVRTLQDGFQKPGAYSVNWDSRDSRGRQVPHGVYFYRLDTPGFRDVKKAVVAR